MFKGNVDIIETTLPSNTGTNITPILIGVGVGVVVIIIAISVGTFLYVRYCRNKIPQETETNEVKMEVAKPIPIDI